MVLLITPVQPDKFYVPEMTFFSLNIKPFFFLTDFHFTIIIITSNHLRHSPVAVRGLSQIWVKKVMKIVLPVDDVCFRHYFLIGIHMNITWD